MALAANPHGFIPHRGANAATKMVTIAATHVAIGKGDVIYETNSGGLALRSDTETNQIGLLGVAATPLAANTGGLLMCWDIDNNALFECQSSEIGTTVGTDITAAQSVANIIANKSVDAAGNSTQSLVITGADLTNAPCVIHYHVRTPLNVPNQADVYPVLLVSFRKVATKLSDGIIS